MEELRKTAKRIRIHILPVKGLTEDTIENKDASALIACSSRPVRLRRALFSDNFCALTFADVTEPDSHNAMQDGHAALIRDYLLGLNTSITDLYICCDSGESRSPAIAAAILTVSGLSDDIIWKNPFYSPNTLVYKRVCNAFGVDIPEEDLIRKKRVNEQAYRDAKQKKTPGVFSRWQIVDMNTL